MRTESSAGLSVTSSLGSVAVRLRKSPRQSYWTSSAASNSGGALETAHRTLQTCGQVFRYAVATGRAERDPSGDLRGALPRVKGEHFAAVTEPEKLAGILRALDSYEGTLVVRCALRLAPLVFVRPGELRHAQWADIDLDGGGVAVYRHQDRHEAHSAPLQSVCSYLGRVAAGYRPGAVRLPKWTESEGATAR